MSHYVLGIDFGTTLSVIAVAEKTGIRFLGEPSLFPSVASWPGKAPWLSGPEALKRGFPVIRSIKSLLGKTEKDAACIHYPHPIRVMQPGVLGVEVAPDTWATPIEIAASILKGLKKKADRALGDSRSWEAVMTVPAHFDEAAKMAVREAARMAGWSIIRLLPEPTAAALAYGLESQTKGLYAVYDIGGGTFDFSILKATAGLFRVIATGGHRALGGDTLDQCVMEQWGLSSLQEAREYRESLTESCRMLRDPDQYLGISEEKKKECTALERCFESVIDETLNICRQTLQDATVHIQDLKAIVLVGGVTRTPRVIDKVRLFFQQEPKTHVNPDTLVAQGAALHARALAEGAEHVLVDVTPLTLGLETYGGLVEPLIPKNTPLPALSQSTYTTGASFQTGLKLHVLQGERPLAQDCLSLAHFELKGIPPLPKGEARIKVTFSLDVQGLLTVKAQEETTGVSQEIVVQPTFRLNDPQRLAHLETAQEESEEDFYRQKWAEKKSQVGEWISVLSEFKSHPELPEPETFRRILAEWNSLLICEDMQLFFQMSDRLEKESIFYVEWMTTEKFKMLFEKQKPSTLDF